MRDRKMSENETRTLTCVYCGMAYPEGTPPHGSKVLTDHIRVCEKHPLRKAETAIAKLRAALIGLIGASDKTELEQMELMLRIAPAPETDKVNAINAIHAIIETSDIKYEAEK
jgi:uncharacterized protein